VTQRGNKQGALVQAEGRVADYDIACGHAADKMCRYVDERKEGGMGMKCWRDERTCVEKPKEMVVPCTQTKITDSLSELPNDRRGCSMVKTNSQQEEREYC